MSIVKYLALFLLAVFLYPGDGHAQSVQLTTIRVASGLSEPLYLTSPAGDTARLFVVEQNTARRLEQAGVDVDGLLAKRRAMSEHRTAAQVNPLLDGLTVRLPGYVLPLEITGRKVTEFLLVPWVGACIHTPPPPMTTPSSRSLCDQTGL